MSSSGSTIRRSVVGNCKCGFPVKVCNSLDPDNYGKKYEGCKFYTNNNVRLGCGHFKWIKEHETQWQKDAIEQLVNAKANLENALLGSVSGTSSIIAHYLARALANQHLW
ncbi:hypothetical protein KSS87_004853 [Heliosperma pusillum]|nr:hypothetical protein KSS87_004853 [Heliosperma pusillum]